MYWLCRMHLIHYQYMFPTDPRPFLTVSPSWLSAGASVTLNCSVKDPTAGWRFYWYTTFRDPSGNFFYRLEQLPGSSSSGTERDSYTVNGQTQTTGYSCRARRGDPVFYSYTSDSKYVWSAGQFVSISEETDVISALFILFLNDDKQTASWKKDSDSPESYTWDSKMAALNVSTQGNHSLCAQSLNKDDGCFIFGFRCSLITREVISEG